jgi:hypothetical protein
MSCCVEQAGEEYSNQCTLSISFSEICCSNVMTMSHQIGFDAPAHKLYKTSYDSHDMFC